MNIEECKDKLKAIGAKFIADKNAILKEYALSNNEVKVGDIVTDHIGSIKVEQIKVTFYSYADIPSQCVYFGLELKKNGEPTKKGGKRDVYQSNLVRW